MNLTKLVLYYITTKTCKILVGVTICPLGKFYLPSCHSVQELKSIRKVIYSTIT